jgi:hypothetical protein
VKNNPLQVWALIVCALSLMAVAVAYFMLFRAGCAADLNSGNGDPLGALEIESSALFVHLVGVLLGGLSIGLLMNGSKSGLACALAFIVLGGIGLWIVGIQIEIWGVQYCLQTSVSK